MVRRFQTFRLLMPLFLSLSGMHAVAAPDSNLAVIDTHPLPNAVQVQVTQKGMKYFDSRLGDLLGNMGIKLDEGYFPAMTYKYDKDINVEDYKDVNPEAVKMYTQVRDLLANWLVGFSLNNHRPVIEIGQSSFVAQFSRFGLVTDEGLMKQLGKQDGAVLAIELDIKQLKISTDSVIAWDVNNEFLGKFGFEDVTVAMDKASAPLKIRLPFYVRMNAYGMLEFSALEVSNNIATTPLVLKYSKLLIPTFAVEINGKKFYMNNKEVDKLLTAQAPTILQKVRENLGTFAKEKLPALLNEKAKEFLSGSIEQVQEMAPPGQEATDRRPNFKWGIKLQSINLKNSLNIALSSYIEDPLNAKSSPKATNASRGPVNLSMYPQDKFDLALTVDRSLINRVLQLSYERKNFEVIRQSNGSSFKLMAAPTFDYVKTPAGVTTKANETFVKLRVSIENRPGSMFLKDIIVIDFDIIAKIRQRSDKTGMQLMLYTIDTDSMYLDDSYMSFMGKLFKGKVRDGVKEELQKQSASWKTTEESIPGSLPLPPEILGIKLDINQVVMDPNGHLVMLLDYAKTGAK